MFHLLISSIFSLDYDDGNDDEMKGLAMMMK